MTAMHTQRIDRVTGKPATPYTPPEDCVDVPVDYGCSNHQAYYAPDAGLCDGAEDDLQGRICVRVVQPAPAGLPLHESADRDADNVPSEALRRAVLLWAERFQPGDRWDPEDLWDLKAALTGTCEAHPTAHHRRQVADNRPSDEEPWREFAEAIRREDAWALFHPIARACAAVEERHTAALRDRLARVEVLADRYWWASAVPTSLLRTALRGPEPTEATSNEDAPGLEVGADAPTPVGAETTDGAPKGCPMCDGEPKRFAWSAGEWMRMCRKHESTCFAAPEPTEDGA